MWVFCKIDEEGGVKVRTKDGILLIKNLKLKNSQSFIGKNDIDHSFHFAVISQLVKGVKTKHLYVLIHI